jgi:hypothetical protein
MLILSVVVVATAQSTAKPRRQAPTRDAKAQAALAFVTEYIRELSAIEKIRDSANKEITQGKKDEEFSNSIYGFTRMQLELRSQVNMLARMHLDPPFETLIPNLIVFDKHKIEIFQKLIDTSSAFIGGPTEGVDYGKLAADVPKLRAQLDDTDNAVFNATPLIFFSLVDMKEDSQHHASHLVITRAERAQLLSDINTDFGVKLEAKDRSYQVGAAIVLKDGLLKDFKSSDDPWE